MLKKGPSAKEKEDRFKLAFGFKDSDKISFEIIAEDYALSDRKSRLGSLLAPMFFEGSGNQATAIILTALHYAKNLNKHSDAEWLKMIEARNEEECDVDSFDDMDREDIRSFCNLIVAYANDEKREITLDDLFSKVLPKDENEALFVAQLLCDGGINKYDLGCSDLTDGLLVF